MNDDSNDDQVNDNAACTLKGLAYHLDKFTFGSSNFALVESSSFRLRSSNHWFCCCKSTWTDQLPIQVLHQSNKLAQTPCNILTTFENQIPSKSFDFCMTLHHFSRRSLGLPPRFGRALPQRLVAASNFIWLNVWGTHLVLRLPRHEICPRLKGETW